VLNRFDSETLQPNLVFFGDSPLGHRASNRIQTMNVTTNYALTARNTLTSTLNSVAQVGYQFQRTQNEGTYAYGQTLTAGTGSLNGVNSDKAVGETYQDNKTAGGFLSEQLSWNDRLFVTGTVRADKNSAFGKNFGTTTYPAASVSYVVIDNGDRLSQLRLRAAFGESGLRPGILDAPFGSTRRTAPASRSATSPTTPCAPKRRASTSSASTPASWVTGPRSVSRTTTSDHATHSSSAPSPSRSADPPRSSSTWAP
jgi:hypothetical protein